MRKDNRGVSLVEIIIVVAIMTIITGGFIIGVSMMSGRAAQKCSQKIVYSLERHRTTAMGKADASYSLYKGADGSIIVKEWTKDADGTVSEKIVPIGDKSVTVTYTVGGTPYDLGEVGSPLVLKFKRGSGGFEAQSGTDYCTDIVVTKAASEYNVKLVPVTGKVYIQ